MTPPLRAPALLLALAVLVGACSASPDPVALEREVTTGPEAEPSLADLGPDAPAADPTTTTTAPRDDPFARPEWLGTRVLPEGPGGFGAVLPTPAELDPRALRTPDHLPDPVGDTFVASIDEVPQAVLERSTWEPGCPVSADELRYVTVTFWGFDGGHHTGELLVHADHADRLVEVFEALHAERFPIEEMRVTAPAELDLPPTGDGNNTSAFVCRVVRGGTSFSEHAHGRAVDVNPFHNPYVRGEVVLPELASTYVDRTMIRPGMIVEGGPVVAAFTRIGWEWGGAWTGTTTDPMHFSATGR